MLASVRAEGAHNSRDLTALVRQVTAVLPDISEDAACEALVQCDEDVNLAVEHLLTRPPPVKKAAKAAKKPEVDKKPQGADSSGAQEAKSESSANGKKGRAKEENGSSAPKNSHIIEEVQAIIAADEKLVSDTVQDVTKSGKGGGKRKGALDAVEAVGESVMRIITALLNQNMSVKARGEGDDGEGQFAILPREARAKTSGEKEVKKVAKKLQEVERIEEKLKNGEKVDPLQLPKLEKKAELLAELSRAEAEAKTQAAAADAEEETKFKSEREAAILAARGVVDEYKAKKLAEKKASAPTPAAAPASAPVPPVPAPTSAPSRAPAADSGMDKDAAGAALLGMLHGGNRQQAAPKQQAQSDWKAEEATAAEPDSEKPAPRWSDEEIMDQFYTTPVNADALSREKRLQAERIAKEIQDEGWESTGRPQRGKGGKDYGGGKGYRRDDGDKGKGDREGKGDRKGKGKREKGDYDRDGKGKGGKGKDDRDGKGKSDRDGKGKGDRDGKGNGDRDGKGKDERDGKGKRDRDNKGKGDGSKGDRNNGTSKGDKGRGDAEPPRENRGWGKPDEPRPPPEDPVVKGLPPPNREPAPGGDEGKGKGNQSRGGDDEGAGSPQRRQRQEREPQVKPETTMDRSRLNW